MFEFYYCVSLDIVHPSVDPKRISEQIDTFRITHQTMAGTLRRAKDGSPIEGQLILINHALAEAEKRSK